MSLLSIKFLLFYFTVCEKFLLSINIVHCEIAYQNDADVAILFSFPLTEMSEKGSQYIDGELENAINGVRQMKLLMEQTSNDHQEILNSLEDTKKKKEVCWHQSFL